MKRLWLITTALMLIGFQSRIWAHEEKDEMNIEAEASMDEAFASEASSAYLNQQKEQQKLDTRLDVAHAEKVVHDSNVQQAYSEALIGKAQTEITMLKRQIADAKVRRLKAQQARKAATIKLSQTVRTLKAYRVRAKRAQALAKQEEREVAAIRARTTKLQRMMMPVKARPWQASASTVNQFSR